MTSFSARTFSVCAFVFFAFALVVAHAPSALASGALAVGQTGNVTKDGIAMGWTTGYADPKGAEAAAMKHCLNFKDAPEKTRKRCKVVRAFEDQCVAIALDPKAGTPGYGYAIRATMTEAKDEAMSRCRETGGNRAKFCVDSDSGCDGKAK